MKKWPLYIVLIGSFNVAIGVNASVPEGFEDLVQEKQLAATLLLNDEARLTAQVSMGEVSASIDESEVDSLKYFLQQHYVSEETAELVVEELVNGVSNSLFCIGSSDGCQVSDEGRQSVQYVMVPEQEAIRILVPPEMMVVRKTERRYIKEMPGESALLMHHRLSAGGGSGSDAYGFYENRATMRALGGYFRSEVNMTTNDDNREYGYFEVDELSYNYLHRSNRFKLGFASEHVERIWNGTTMLAASEEYRGLSVDYGSTRELEFSSSNQSPRLYFSIPSAGRLRVTRDDGTPVFERNVRAGQNYVSYSELPKGINTFTFTVLAGERVLYREVHKIYNNNNEVLATGEWDYLFSIGQLYERDIVHNRFIEDDMEYYRYEAFTEARVATQLTTDWLLGLGMFNTSQDYFARAAIEYRPEQDIRFNALYGRFEDNSDYYQAALMIYGFRVDWSRFDDNSENPVEMSLANYFYGFGTNEEWTASFNQPLFGGSAYVNYTRFKNEGAESVFNNEDQEFIRYSTVTAGYAFRTWLGSSVDLSMTYYDSEDVDNVQDDEVTFGINVSVPLGVESYLGYSVEFGERYERHRASVGSSHRFNDALSVNGELGMNYDDYDGQDSNTLGDLSLSANYHDDYVRGSAFAYASTDDSYSGSANMSSSTLFNGKDVVVTSEEADSYLIVRNRGDVENVAIDDSGAKFLSVAVMRQNGDNGGRLILNDDEVVSPIDLYREYEIVIDEDASDYHNEGQSHLAATSFPGTLLAMDVDMREIKSYISIFNDIEGNPVNTVECRGTGCVDVEELVDGVFKFRVSAGLPFELRTSAQRCLIPPPSEFDGNNLGSNFCMPAFEESEDGMKLTRGQNGNFYYYIGEFNDGSLVERYESQLEDEPLTFIRKTVGSRTFLFVEAPFELDTANVGVLSTLEAYALEETLEQPFYVFSRTEQE
ncbi:hypothetical protein C9I98_07225 [Photobacterium sanctipauli]|uniref:Pilus assembly protein C-terminal domain-containing protein n=1 Tax=Photobacterium sanctipauli TaxID=1342794 RepID=A0A2T3NWH1_9GAMM|nr:CS1-pili formation C-terminal domain-containing protein [Photobacterium sanctipauli]PSW20633.1 hypothetical protein C9I98_07225 [Photobacterium sanctipauli]